MSRLRNLCDSVAIVNPEMKVHDNGAQYFEFKVLPSMNKIHGRLEDIPIEEVRKIVYRMKKESIIEPVGTSKYNTVYVLAKKKWLKNDF